MASLTPSLVILALMNFPKSSFPLLMTFHALTKLNYRNFKCVKIFHCIFFLHTLLPLYKHLHLAPCSLSDRFWHASQHPVQDCSFLLPLKHHFLCTDLATCGCMSIPHSDWNPWPKMLALIHSCLPSPLYHACIITHFGKHLWNWTGKFNSVLHYFPTAHPTQGAACIIIPIQTIDGSLVWIIGKARIYWFFVFEC